VRNGLGPFQLHRFHLVSPVWVESSGESSLLLGLEVVEEDRALLRLLTPVLDDDARAVDDLARVALTVDLACGDS
jgi:hypothetical protein